MLSKKDKICVVAPHADDEILGCGGLLSLATQAGVQVCILFVSISGVTNGNPTTSRKKEIDGVISELGECNYDIFHTSGVELPYDDAYSFQRLLVAWLESEASCSFNKFSPTILCIPGRNHHQDHVEVNKACIASLRISSRCFFKPRIVLEYEQPTNVNISGLTLQPNFYITLTRKSVEEKCRLFSSYASQLKDSPSHRSLHAIRTLAAYRGMEVGCDFAEAYLAVRVHV